MKKICEVKEMKPAVLVFVFLFGVLGTCAQGDIRKVDFLNFTFEPSCAGEENTKVTVKNGEFSSEKQEDGYVDRFYFKVFDINYGDVTGDRVDDAVMLSVCNTGGTGNFTEGFVYSMRGGKPTLVARIPGGDRADGGLRDVSIDGGLIVIVYNDPEKTSGACCPEGIVTQKLRVSDNGTIEVGPPIKRDLFPTQRVTFAKGTSGTTLKLTIRANEGKRLVVGARAGQILSVSTNTDKAAVSLEEEAEVTNAPNGFSATLPKNGDYTIRVTNYEDTALIVIVNIKIN